VGSAVAALAATGVMHLLAVATPQPTMFFGWIMVLVTLIGVVLPLSLGVGVPTKIATALLNLAIGLVITLLVVGTANSALRLPGVRAVREAYPPTREWDQPRL
jgi:hypothetical protein